MGPRYAREVLPGSGVDLDALARFDEQWHLHDEARLQSGRLAGTRDAIALHTRFGLGDGELDRGGKLHPDDARLVHHQDGGVAFLQVVHRTAEIGRLHVQLVVGLVVHEDQRVALTVEVLHLALVDHRERHLLVGAERALHHRAARDPLELGAHERATLARLDVLELDDRAQADLGQVERHAVLEVVGRDAHNTSSFGKAVRGSEPSGVTTTVSSMRAPPTPGRYTPGSTVTTAPGAKVSRAFAATRGDSWISRPTP